MTRLPAVTATTRADMFDWAEIFRQLPGVKALTVRQPWAWAIMHGKPVENRRSRILPEGRLAWLHAGSRKRRDAGGEASVLIQEAWKRITGRPLTLDSAEMPFGAVVALMKSGGCHHAADCARTETTRGRHITRMCTPWAAEGQVHILLARVAPLAAPVPCRGMPGLWPLKEDTLAAVRMQVAAFAEAQQAGAAQPG